MNLVATFLNYNFSDKIEDKNKGNTFLLITFIGLICFYLFEKSRLLGFFLGFSISALLVILIYFYDFIKFKKPKKIEGVNYAVGEFAYIDKLPIRLVKKSSNIKELIKQNLIEYKLKKRYKLLMDLRGYNSSFKIDNDEAFNDLYELLFFIDLNKIDRVLDQTEPQSYLSKCQSIINSNSKFIIANFEYIDKLLATKLKEPNNDKSNIYKETFSEIKVIKLKWQNQEIIKLRDIYHLHFYLKIILNEDIDQEQLKEPIKE